MAKERKTQIIDEIAEELRKSKIVVVTDYRGLPAKELSALRRHMVKNESGYRVVKNTLARFAARKTGNEKMESLLTGPVALAFGYGDITGTVKALQEHIRTAGSVLQITGALLGDRVIDRKMVLVLAMLPSREVLLAQLLGSLKAPMQRFHYAISSPLRGLAGVLKARVTQMEQASKTAAAG